MKSCSNCGEIKSLDAFDANPRGRGGSVPECKDRAKQRRREWYIRKSAREVERVRQWSLANPGKVAARVAATRGSEKKKLADREAIRGLLWFRCNNALGDFREEYELFQRAGDDLDRDDELAELVRVRAGALAR